jgi:hypothetical protein
VFNLSCALSGTEGEDQCCDIPPKEKPSVFRNLGQIELQLREAIPLARQETSGVRVHLALKKGLVHALYSNAGLEFVAAPALAPAEVAVDAALMAQYDQELRQVCSRCPDLISTSLLMSRILGRGCTTPRRRRRSVITPSPLSYCYISDHYIHKYLQSPRSL